MEWRLARWVGSGAYGSPGGWVARAEGVVASVDEGYRRVSDAQSERWNGSSDVDCMQKRRCRYQIALWVKGLWLVGTHIGWIIHQDSENHTQTLGFDLFVGFYLSLQLIRILCPRHCHKHDIIVVEEGQDKWKQ